MSRWRGERLREDGEKQRLRRWRGGIALRAAGEFSLATATKQPRKLGTMAPSKCPNSLCAHHTQALFGEPNLKLLI